MKIESLAMHDIGWVDLITSDLQSSIEFYRGLFGWTTFQDGDYHVLLKGDAPVGGVMALTPEMGEMPPAWSTYVAVADADASVAAASAGGGTVLQPPMEVTEGQRIAVIADPSGAAICLFEGLGESHMAIRDEVGAPCWYDCNSRDVGAAIDFYKQLFGWTSEDMAMADMTYTLFSNDGNPTCGAMQMHPMVPAEVPSHWMVNFVVADADAAVAYVTDNGGTVAMGPVDTPFGRSATVTDPWGAVLNVIDRSSAVQ